MMTTTYYQVEKKYQKDDGILNLSMRRVSKYEIKNLKIEKFNGSSDRCHWMGDKSSVFLFNHHLDVE